MRSSKNRFRIIATVLLAICVLSGCNANNPSNTEVPGTSTAPNEEKEFFFPPPAEILINCKYGNVYLSQGTEMYDYVYSRINERVPEEGMIKMDDVEYDPFNVYRRNDETYVTFSYTVPGVEGENCFLRLDNNNPEEITEVNYLFFPLSGKATNGVLRNKRFVDEDTGEQYYETYCHGPLSIDQELYDEIWEYIGQVKGTTVSS